MISREIWQYSLQNLMSRKVRSFLTILSIFVGIATIFIFVSFGWGLYDYVEQASSDIGVDKLVLQSKGIGPPGQDSAFRLEEKDIEAFAKTRGISDTAALMFENAKVERDRQVKYNYIITLPAEDVRSDKLAREFFTLKLHDGRHLEKGDLDRVTIGFGYTIPDRIFNREVKVNDKITVNGYDLKVIGIYTEIGNPSDDGNLYMTEDTFLKITGNNKSYAFVVGRVENYAEIESVQERAIKNVRKSRGLEEGKEDFFIQTFEQLIEVFRNSLNIVIGFVVLIALISVLISAINTSNTMFTSILERTKEIGVIKSIGARNSEILLLFLLEASVLGFIAGIIGSLVGAFFAYLGGVILKAIGFGFLQPHISWMLFVGCILFATLVGAVSGAIPAYQASRKNPVDSLRYE